MTTPTQDTITARLEEVLARATPIRDGWNLRLKDDGTERYDLIGHPCGFPVATFGDANDAALDLAFRQLVPALLSERSTLKAELEEARGVLEPFAAVAEHVEQFDPDYPEDGAALRASFDWFDSRLGEHQSLRFSAFRAARAYLTKEPNNGR